MFLHLVIFFPRRYAEGQLIYIHFQLTPVQLLFSYRFFCLFVLLRELFLLPPPVKIDRWG